MTKEKGKRAEASNSKRSIVRQKGDKQFPFLSPFLYGVRKTSALLSNRWMIALFTCLRWNFSLSSQIRRIWGTASIVEGRATHSSSVLLSEGSLEKYESGEILFHEGAVSINDLLFLKHNDKGECQVMMTMHNENEIQRDEQQ